MVKLDNKFFSDERIRAIRAEFGAAGVLLVIELMNEMFESPNGYWRPWALVDQRAFAFDHGMNPNELDAMIRRLVDFGFVDAELLESEILSSEWLEREFIRQRGKSRWNRIRTHYSFLSYDQQIELGLVPAEVDEFDEIPRSTPMELQPLINYSPENRKNYRRIRLKSGPRGLAVFRLTPYSPDYNWLN